MSEAQQALENPEAVASQADVQDAPLEGYAGVQVDMRRVMRELETKLRLEEQRTLLHKPADKYVRIVLVESPSRPMSPSNDMSDLSEVLPEPEFGYG